jgi:DNA-binding GntR family transcriptional regulator
MPLPTSAEKMARTLAREEAYTKLRGWIIDGALQGGEVLRDQAIATALGVSRTPVREALRRLEDEGFVVTALNRWTRVAPLDVNKAAETYQVIEALEVLALELAFAHLTREDLQRLADANRAMQQAAEQQDPAAAVRADESFHEIWIGRANNSELVTLLGQLKTKLRRVELAYFDAAARARQSFHEHAAILKALHKRSPLDAAAALRANWRGSIERMRAFAEKRAPQLPPSNR